MPALIVTDKIDAVLKNGVLEVRIPKAEEAKPRTIAVKSPN
jgi:HSP20 family molecular chaperone IbpA